MNIPSRTNDIQIPKRFDEADVPDEGLVERKQPKWKHVHSQGTRPSPRSGHSAVVGSHSMYIFAGRDGNTFKSDIFAYKFDSRTWSEITTTGARPPPRYGHKAVCYNNQMVLFGGHAATSYLNDLYLLDLDTYVWEKLEPEGQIPSPRWQHSMVIWRGLLIIFGGCDSTSYLNDLYSFDFERNTWQPMLVDDYSIPPAPRMMHGAIICGERMLVFGGQCVDSIRNDFFEYNFELNIWNFIGVAEGRFRRNFSCLEIAGSFLLFGGYSVGLHNDVLRFDFDTGTWNTIDIQGKAPSPRSGHTSVTFDERVYIFGGVSNEGAQNDMHVLSLGYLNHETTSSSAPRVGSYTDHEFGVNSPLDTFLATSPLESNYLHRFKTASGLGETLTPHNKDESPLIVLFREEIQKLKSELEECRKENMELKRELATFKAEKAEKAEDTFLLY